MTAQRTPRFNPNSFVETLGPAWSIFVRDILVA